MSYRSLLCGALLSALSLSPLPSFAASELFFSEYIEGSSNNKALEIANTTGAAVDLSPYEVQMFFNGNTTANLTINLMGSVDNEDVFVLANSRASASILSQADQQNGASWFNGDDTVILLRGGVPVDAIGQVGFDPGSEWGSAETSTQNNTLRRLMENADNNPNDAFEPSLEWQGFAQDNTDDLGRFATCNDGNSPILCINEIDAENTGTLPVAMGQCGDSATLISAIQGNTTDSPLVEQSVEVEAIVVGDFQSSRQLNGFYIQEEAGDQDNLAETSEGLFIAADDQIMDVQVGDRVRVAGRVAEVFGLSQINRVTGILYCDSGINTAAKAVHFPLNNSTDLEALEGMLITLPQTMVVSENFNLGRFHEVVLASERLFQPTQLVAPGATALAVQAENALKRIILDDASTVQNPEPVSYPAPQLNALNSLRSGDTVAGVTGIMSYGFNAYRIQPTEPPNFVASNLRTSKPDIKTQGNLSIASFNVLNYFNGDGLGGGFPTPRGADTAAEFKRQRDKIINALLAIDADIVGLVELENDGYDENSAIADLVKGLNANGQEYTFVNPGLAQIGTDAIAVGFIYKTNKVATFGKAAILDSRIDSRFIDSKNRPALAQTFQTRQGGRLTIAVNHFKSKGSACDDVGDPNQNDGQGNCNATRTLAAQALADWLATDPTQSGDSDLMIIGDLNAYAKEDPITALITSGYQDLIADAIGSRAYSFVFAGQFGYLDYVMVNKSLAEQVVDVVEWPINADEPRVLDYNEEFKSPQQLLDWYSTEPYRASDHDPVIVHLNLLGLRGDFNHNGRLDSRDFRRLLRAVYKKTQSPLKLKYDMNDDGKLNRKDLRRWLRLKKSAKS